jgi:hypothetical protein
MNDLAITGMSPIWDGTLFRTTRSKNLAELSVAENTVSYLVFYMLEKCSYFY